MFSGLQEIFLILLIVLAIFFLPRLTGRRPAAVAPGRVNRRPRPRLSGPLRSAILASLAWLFLTAVYIEPWQRDLTRYLYAGAAPVALFWGILWIVAGFRNRRR
ncbi:MAG: hypothetical protein WAK95_00420 [Desulfobacterales bacterium]